ncbi:cell wall-binding repeat-containing protein [bacterium]|nr:cell wall-binding repeat-containing protein [bacterium]
MHKTCTSEAHRNRALVGLVAGVLLACTLVLAAPPDKARAVAARTTDDPAVQVLIEPAPHDGERGWRGTLTHVWLLPRAAGTVYYCFDQTIGPWQRATGPLIVPEGKHTLHALLVGPDGAVGETVHVPFKVEYKTPVRAPYLSAASGTATGTVSVSVTVNPHPGAFVQRIGGLDRYETATLIANENVPTADVVIIATGATFADALTASGLAGCLDAPVLLTRQAELPPSVIAQIGSLGATKAIVVGGDRAVSPTVASSLSALGLTVRRIGGADRYDTAALIGREVMGFGRYGGRVFIARGDNFADALSLGPLAYSARAPLLLVRPTAVPTPTRSLLSASAFSSGCIAGGTAAVSPQVFALVDSYVGAVTRISGDNRYGTSASVAAYGVSSGLASFKTVGVATGTMFADALCGGVAIGSRGGVILLTRPDYLSPETEAAIAASAQDISEVQVYGGDAAIQPVVIERVRQMLL